MAKKDDALTERAAGLSGAIFLIGLAILFMVDAIWPGILWLIWLTAIPVLLVEEGWMGVWVMGQLTIWMAGLAVLLTIAPFFPGILVLAGLSALLLTIAPPDKVEKNKHAWPFGEERKRKRKPKRALPLPPAEDYLGDEGEYDTDDWESDEIDDASYAAPDALDRQHRAEHH